MPVFVKLLNVQRQRLFAKLKERINTSWENFYPKYNISRAMFFNYVSGKYDIPKVLFMKWKQIAAICLSNIKYTEKRKYTEKEIPKIQLDEKLAEIMGILNGDGYISPLNYEICVVGNSLEKDYLAYLKKLFELKFKINFTFMIDKSKFKLRTYSKELFNVLTKEYDLPKGNKIGKLKIPLKIKNSNKLLIPYLRGLFDTDGTIYKRRKKDIVLEISSADKRYLNEIKNLICSLGFNAKKYEKHINLYKMQDIIKFFEIIRPANTKHLNKYNIYLKLCTGGPENL